MNTAAVPASKTRIIFLWVLRILLAALFLLTGFMKLSGQPMMVTEFQTIDLGQWFRYFTGLLEVLGAIGLLTPRFSVFGAGLLLLIDIGAFVAQLAVLHMDWIHPIVIGLLIAAVIRLQRSPAAS